MGNSSKFCTKIYRIQRYYFFSYDLFIMKTVSLTALIKAILMQTRLDLVYETGFAFESTSYIQKYFVRKINLVPTILLIKKMLKFEQILYLIFLSCIYLCYFDLII